MNDFVNGLTIALTYVMLLTLTWAFALLMTWLISLCFGEEWNILIGTGVWLCCVLLRIAVYQRNGEAND